MPEPVDTAALTATAVYTKEQRAIDWLNEAARYFENRPSNGEDGVFWSNTQNAHNARQWAELIDALRQRATAAEAERNALEGANEDCLRLGGELASAEAREGRLREALGLAYRAGVNLHDMLAAHCENTGEDLDSEDEAWVREWMRDLDAAAAAALAASPAAPQADAGRAVAEAEQRIGEAERALINAVRFAGDTGMRMPGIVWRKLRELDATLPTAVEARGSSAPQAEGGE